MSATTTNNPEGSPPQGWNPAAIAERRADWEKNLATSNSPRRTEPTRWNGVK